MYVAYIRDFSHYTLKLRAAFESTLPTAKKVQRLVIIT